LEPGSPVLILARLFGAFFIGALLGLIPFFVARKRGQQGLGVAGLVASIVGGLILGILLAAPVAFVFTIIALVRQPSGPAAPPSPPGPGAAGGPPGQIG
jgi:hypothetical protein